MTKDFSGMISFEQYQDEAVDLAIYPDEVAGPYLHLKLCGEAGEAAEKLGKAMRKDGHAWTVDKFEMAKELGDVLWYLANLADFYGFTLEEIARINLEKLHDRKDRNVIEGNGDNR